MTSMSSAYASKKLKRSHDKGSSCLKPRTVSNGSERYTPTLTELQELLNVILNSLISFVGIPSSDIAVKARTLIGLSKATKYGVCRLVFRGSFLVFDRVRNNISKGGVGVVIAL